MSQNEENTNLGKLDKIILLLGGDPAPSNATHNKLTDGVNVVSVTDMGGGKYGLVVDTELTIDGGTFNIDNILVANDGVDDTKLKTNADGELELAGSTNNYFVDGTTDATSGDFATPKTFGFNSDSLVISNDSGNVIEFSFDGSTIHGNLKSREVLTFSNKKESDIYLRSTSGADTYRVWAY